MNSERKINRRDFLIGAGASIASLFISACGGKSNPRTEDQGPCYEIKKYSDELYSITPIPFLIYSSRRRFDCINEGLAHLKEQLESKGCSIQRIVDLKADSGNTYGFTVEANCDGLTR